MTCDGPAACVVGVFQVNLAEVRAGVSVGSEPHVAEITGACGADGL